MVVKVDAKRIAGHFTYGSNTGEICVVKGYKNLMLLVLRTRETAHYLRKEAAGNYGT